MLPLAVPSTYHHGDLQRALLDAAEHLLETEGIDGVTVRKAARQAGVSTGAPYRHFKDRDALMSALAARGHRQMQARMTAAMADLAPGLPQLRAQGITYVLFAQERPAMFRAMHHAPWMARGASDAMDAVLDDMETWTQDLAQEAAASGEMAAGALPAQVLACRALVYGLARLFVDGHAEQMGIAEADPVALVEQVIDVIGVGLAPR